MNNSLKKKTIRNLVYSFMAQIISMSLSILMSLVVPRILGVTEFSYWQLFLFFINYVGFFHFGITDGMYLKTGGMQYEELDKKNISSQFYSLLCIQIVVFGIVVISAVFLIVDSIRKSIFILTGIYMIFANLNWFIGYVFQATNRVKLYSISVMIDKLFFLGFIIVAALFSIENIFVYMIAYISTTGCALVFSVVKSVDILKTKPLKVNESLKITKDSAKVGVNLTLANVSSLLILGIGRFIVDRIWGIESFGKFSLSLSLTNFFLLFIAQVSIVLFPTIRQVDKNTAKNLYSKLSRYLDSILPMIFVLYVPMKKLLSWWLPQYAVSLDYLAILLPICIFDGKMQMVNNTYFKVLRRERDCLKINIITVLISLSLTLVAVFVFENMNCVIFAMLVSIVFRSFISELYLTKVLEIERSLRNLYCEIIFSALFIAVNAKFNMNISFLIIIVLFVIYMVVTGSFGIYKECLCKIKEKLS